jgi:hypothetical protein
MMACFWYAFHQILHCFCFSADLSPVLLSKLFNFVLALFVHLFFSWNIYIYKLSPSSRILDNYKLWEVWYMVLIQGSPENIIKISISNVLCSPNLFFRWRDCPCSPRPLWSHSTVLSIKWDIVVSIPKALMYSVHSYFFSIPFSTLLLFISVSWTHSAYLIISNNVYLATFRYFKSVLMWLASGYRLSYKTGIILLHVWDSSTKNWMSHKHQSRNMSISR